MGRPRHNRLPTGDMIMKIKSTNGGSILYIELTIEEFNNYAAWENAHQYDIGFNEGWEMAEKENADAEE